MPQRSSFWPETAWGDDLDPGSDTYYDDPFSSYVATDGDQYKLFTLSDTIETYSFGGMFPTAASKQNTFNSAFSDSCEQEWVGKPVQQWSAKDVMNWALSVIDEQGISDYEDLKLGKFHVEGSTLCSWSKSDFVENDPVFGSILYIALQAQLNEEENKSAYNRLFEEKPEFKYLPPFPTIKLSSDRLSPTLAETVSSTLTELKVARDYMHPDSGSEQSSSFSSLKSEDDIHDRNLLKKKRGRPVGNRSKRKAEKKCGRLWEFIRDLLLKPEYCPSLICWENHDEGVFRFVRSDKVAELWGTIKDNPKMTYEKLSRAMRYYYKSKVLQPVFGRRLVYKFGPTARGWRTDNPNFRQPIPCE